MQEEKLIKLNHNGTEIRLRTDNTAEVGVPVLVVGRRWTTIMPSDYQQVYLEFESYRTKSERTYYTYFIGLEGPEKRLPMGEIDGDRHGTAEQVARLLNLGMVDRSRGGEISREAGHLDDSIRQQATRSLQPVPSPIRPVDPTASCKIDGNIVTFIVPPGKPDMAGVGFVLGLTGAFGLALMTVNIAVGFIISVLMAIGMAVSLAWVKAKFATPVAVAVSPDELVWQIGGKNGRRFLAQEIEELGPSAPTRDPQTTFLKLRTDHGAEALELRAGTETNLWIVSTVRYLLSEEPEKIDWALLKSWA